MDFSTALKIAIKAGLIAVVTVAIIALFANVTIPGLDFTVFTQRYRQWNGKTDNH